MRSLMRGVMILAVLTLPEAGFAVEFSLTSPTIKDHATIGNDHVFNGFGCTGQNISPQLQWEHAPKDTKSFALTVYDPDAPTGSGWWHWVIFYMAPTVTALPAGGKIPISTWLP